VEDISAAKGKPVQAKDVARKRHILIKLKKKEKQQYQSE
jgi:hypothetical protein